MGTPPLPLGGRLPGRAPRRPDGPTVRTQAELEQALRRGFTPRCIGNGEFRVGGHSQVWAFDGVGVTATGHATVRAADQARVAASDEVTVWALGQASVAGDGETMVFGFDDSQVLLRGSSLGEAYDRAVFEIYAGAAVRAHDHSSVEAFDNSRVIALDDATVLALGCVGVLATDLSQVTAGERSQVTVCGGSPSVTPLEVGPGISPGTPLQRLTALHQDTVHPHCGGCGGAVAGGQGGLCTGCRGRGTPRPDAALARTAALRRTGLRPADGRGDGMAR